MSWVDAHCHIDQYPDPTKVAEEAESRRVYTVAVTNTPSRFFEANLRLRDFKYVRPALGLHPQLAPTHQHELTLFKDLLSQTRYIGEVGIDGGDSATRAAQRSSFQKVLDLCAASGGKVLTVHSRRAEKDVVDCIGNRFPGCVILHWYTGSLQQLERALEYGFFFSVNTAMLKSQRGKSLIQCIPRDRVLTETDGPFTRLQRRHCKPVDVEITVHALAGLWGTTLEQARAIVKDNLRAVVTKQPL